MAITKDLGIVTAYGYAVGKGYTGTEEEFAELMNDVAESAGTSEAWAAGTIAGTPVTPEAEQYHNNAKYYAEQASGNAENAEQSKDKAKENADTSEAWAVGTVGGVPVEEGQPGYNDNAKYYADQASDSADAAANSEAAAKDYSDHIADPVSGIVTEWLNEHVDPESQVVIDDSLSIAGAAADAKATGDAVADLKSAIGESYTNVKSILERGIAGFLFAYENGGVNLANGNDNTDNSKYRTKGKISFGEHSSVSIQYFGTKDIKAGWCWFDANGVYVGYQSSTSISNKVTIQNSYPFYRFQFSNADGSAVTADDMKHVLLGFNYSVDNMQAYSSLDDYFHIVPTGTAQTGLLSGYVGQEISADSSYTDYQYRIVDISAGDCFQIIENINGSGNNGYLFTDNDGIIISKGQDGINGSPYINEIYVSAPSGSTKLYLNYYGDKDPVLLRKTIVPKGHFDLPSDQDYQDTVIMTGLVSTISGWVPTVDGSFTLYSYFVIRSRPGEKYLIDGYYSGAGNKFIIEVAEDGSYLRTKITGQNNVVGHYHDVFTLASDAYGIVVCYRNDHAFSIKPLISIPLANKFMEVDTRFQEVEKEIDDLAGQKPFDGKTAVFFGTSIPAGSVVINGVSYSIPKYIGKLLGLTVINEAVGSSMARRGWKEKETANDPYGWTDIAWQNVFLGLGKNLSECEDLISNYDTKWKDIIGGDFAPAGQDGTGIGKPNTMVEPWITRIRESSYENKLIPYLDGTKPMPDLFIFEHGHNDVKSFDANTLTGIASVNPDDIGDLDRSLFGDAMAFYIRLIWQANPHAKILIVSNYENDSDLYKKVFTSQKEVAESNKVWFCDVADVIGWSAVKKITTTGYWSNGTNAGTWIPSGGTSHTITCLEAAFPDKVHPHTDLSGKAIIREAEIIAGYIKTHISL